MLVHHILGSLNDSNCVAVKFYVKHIPIYKMKGGFFFFCPSHWVRKAQLTPWISSCVLVLLSSIKTEVLELEGIDLLFCRWC